jgi:uncharacterized protein YjbI with pentapeptide repeats
MKSIILPLIAGLALASPALAQNAAQVASIQRGGNCPGCNLFQADMANKELKGRNYSKARLRQADFSASVMNGSNFSGADMRDLNAYGVVFTGVNMAGADLTNATFVGAYLQGANFRGAKLAGANFSGAEMDRAIGLTQTQLSQACGDGSTRLPKGLSAPPCR